MPLLVDASALVALADAGAAEHAVLRDFLYSEREALIVPVTALVEADYLVASRLGVRVELAMLRSIVAGDMSVGYLGDEDLRRAVELVAEYADADIGFADASLVALGERLDIPRILTLDRRHFTFIRPRHRPTFELVPGI